MTVAAAAAIDWSRHPAGGGCRCHPGVETLRPAAARFAELEARYECPAPGWLEVEFGRTYSGRAWDLAYRVWWWTHARPYLLELLDHPTLAHLIGEPAGYSSFQLGWAVNAVRQMFGLAPVANPALRFVALSAWPHRDRPLPSCRDARADLDAILARLPERN